MRRIVPGLAMAIAAAAWGHPARAAPGDCASLAHGPLSLAAAQERFPRRNRDVRAAGPLRDETFDSSLRIEAAMETTQE